MVCSSGVLAAVPPRAAQAGTVPLPQSPEAAAQVLVGLLLGLHSLIKARTEDAMARSYAAAAAGLMRSWEVS